uniref:DUF4433 domain-containing protein n=1 Tax=Strongyloides stercoralis TaxID=6248 RepID=A0A0K0DWQ3_STRER
MAHCLNYYINKQPNNYLYIKLNEKYYRGKIGIFDKELCNKFEHRCQMEVHYVDFYIPWKIAQKINTVNIFNVVPNRKQTFNISKAAAYNKPYYRLTHNERNDRIILYYKNLSPEVYNLLQYYIKIKLVILIPASNYPFTKLMNPSNLIHADSYRFSSKEAILLHARSNYILLKKNNLSEVEIFKENERENLITRYMLIQKQINMTLPFIYGPLMGKYLESCMSLEVKKQAKVSFAIYDKCKTIMDGISKWIY